MNKNESKYFNTAIKFDEALLSLLEKKDFEYISIKEICEAAGVNRSTFYLHYENTSDLLEECSQYILDRHFSYYALDKKDIVFKPEDCEKNDLIFITKNYTSPYLTFIKDNRRVFKTVIKQFHTMKMNKVYDKMFKRIFEPILIKFDVPPKECTYVIKFYLTGLFAIITEWLENDCIDEIDFIIKIINDCILGERHIHV